MLAKSIAGSRPKIRETGLLFPSGTFYLLPFVIGIGLYALGALILTGLYKIAVSVKHEAA